VRREEKLLVPLASVKANARKDLLSSVKANARKDSKGGYKIGVGRETVPLAPSFY
jgi:hypothetical protein